jgi:hypothetical protein
MGVSIDPNMNHTRVQLTGLVWYIMMDHIYYGIELYKRIVSPPPSFERIIREIFKIVFKNGFTSSDNADEDEGRIFVKRTDNVIHIYALFVGDLHLLGRH